MSENKPPHPTVQIPNIKLEPFEKNVYTHQYEEAGTMLIEMLKKLRVGAQYIGYPTDSASMHKLHTRMAAAVFALMADPQFELSAEGFIRLCPEHFTMDFLFRASAFDSSDHMLPQIADVKDAAHPDQLSFGDPIKLIKFLLTYSLRSGFALRFRETFSKNPQILYPLYIGMLSHLVTVDAVAQAKREDLLTMPEIFEDIMMTDPMLPMLADAYMYTSYGIGPKRHAFKAVAHRLCAKMMEAHAVSLPSEAELKSRRENLPAKPVMVIPLDWFTSLHAMYRCWVPAIRQLRKHFKLIAFSQPSAIDDMAKREFDEWHEVPVENIALSDIIKRINVLKPDIIYYPSVGMTLWWIVAASLRIAPIQVMTLGHPSSSFSSAMDYVIGDAGTFVDQSLFSERIVELPEGSLFHFDMRPDAEFPPLLGRLPDPEVVRIAIPAMVCKLSSPFMNTLKKIRETAKTKVEFHFFPNMTGIILFQTAREIRAWLPDAFIYERNAYNQYLQFMNRCDMALCTFPFGGTNSNIDSMKLGLPLVAMERNEPFERFDAIMLRKVGMPDWCITTDEDGYLESAVRMIDNHSERLALRDYLLNAPLEDIFFKKCDDQHFGNAMVHLYKNHEVIVDSGERWIKL